MISAISKELSKAHDLLENAMRNFNEIDPELTDIAIYEVMAAESRYNALLRQARESKECVENVSNEA